MKLSLVSYLLAIAAGISYSSASPAKRDAFSDQALSAHNTNRARYGAGPLTWDNNLANGAASYAAQCNFAHSGGNYGENLAASTGSLSAQGAVNMWMGEASQYDYNNPGFSAETGHFTQVVWKGSRTVGCGQHQCTGGGPFGGQPWTYIVCRYSPPGNVIGQFPANVGRPQ